MPGELEQQWSGVWYPQTLLSLRNISGDGPTSASGIVLPNIPAISTLGVLGLVTPAVLSAIDRYVKQVNGYDAGYAAVSSSSVDDNGLLSAVPVTGNPALDALATDTGSASFINSKTYLQYQPYNDGISSSRAWERFPPDFSAAFQVWNRGENLEIFSMIRQMISDWQRMVYASASALAIAAANTNQPTDSDNLDLFFSALGSLCGDFDVLNESPPSSGDINGALRYALAKSSEFVGKAGAEIANEVGKDAGIIGSNLTEGFLQNAGILSFIVLAIVIHLFL
jgi:hypothetical protein